MHSPQSQEVVARFYMALIYLINAGVLKSRNEYCKRYGIVQGHLSRVEKNNASKIFDIGWMTPLISDYGISAHWLMTGRGEMVFKSPPDGMKRVSPATKQKNEKEVEICPSCANVVQPKNKKTASD